MTQSMSLLRTAAPPTLEKRLEVIQAMNALAAQENDLLRHRRAQIVVLRQELEALRRACAGLGQTLRRACRGQVLA